MTTPCAQQPDLWFSEDRHSIKRAKAICGGCPVRLECLKVALDGNEAFGIFGGLTPVERARLSPTATGDRLCAIEECDTPLPIEAERRNRRYCSPQHSQLGSRRAYIARQAAS